MEVGTLWQVVVIVVAIIGGAVYLASALSKQRTRELEGLAETRGHRIEDLETRLNEVRDEFQKEISELRGQVQALQALKVTEIADEVVARLQDMGWQK